MVAGISENAMNMAGPDRGMIQNWAPRVSTGMAHGMTKQWIKLTVADCDICDLDVTRVDDVSHHRGERNLLFIAT